MTTGRPYVTVGTISVTCRREFWDLLSKRRHIVAGLAIVLNLAAPSVAKDAVLQEVDALSRQVERLYLEGQYAKAISLAQRALVIHDTLQVKGPERVDRATLLNNLAELYRATGKYDEAEKLYDRALAIRVKSLGPEHPDTALSLNNLAALYRTTGNLAKAEPLYRQALAISERTLGLDHPDTALLLNNLGALYVESGDYARAEALFQQALRIRKQVFGPENADTATSLSNLAELYFVQGDYTRAKPLYQQALAIRQKTLGSEHRDTATTVSTLAALDRAIGRSVCSIIPDLSFGQTEVQTGGRVEVLAAPKHLSECSNIVVKSGAAALLYEVDGEHVVKACTTGKACSADPKAAISFLFRDKKVGGHGLDRDYARLNGLPYGFVLNPDAVSTFVVPGTENVRKLVLMDQTRRVLFESNVGGRSIAVPVEMYKAGERYYWRITTDRAQHEGSFRIVGDKRKTEIERALEMTRKSTPDASAFERKLRELAIYSDFNLSYEVERLRQEMNL